MSLSDLQKVEFEITGEYKILILYALSSFKVTYKMSKISVKTP